jgi:hypothetical protein
MIVKILAAGVAAVAAVGAAASGIAPTVTLTATNSATSQVVLAVFGRSPQPAITDVPTTEQLTGVLKSLADPGVPFTDKTGLVEGGIGSAEASMADHKLQKAARKGELPLSFTVANIAPAGPGAATADVSVSGPKLAAQTMNVSFVDQDGWKLSRDSVASLLQAASAK